MNRKLERKLKELRLQADEEHVNLQSHTEQVGMPEGDLEPNVEELMTAGFTLWSTPQLTQRLKTTKRQMDEAEEEIERLEHSRKKLQRELDEQLEANEQLLGQLGALRNEMR